MSTAVSGVRTGQGRGRNESSEWPAGHRSEGRVQSLLRYRVVAVVAAHVFTFVTVYLLAYVLRFDGAAPRDMVNLAIRTVAAVVGLKLLAFWMLGSFRGWWRYATFADFVGLAEAATLGSVMVVLFNNFVARPLIPRSIVIIDWAATILVLGGIRGSTRFFRERYYPMLSQRSQTRVLIVGASDAGIALVRAIHGQDKRDMKVVGFVDDNRSVRGLVISGIKVLGTTKDLARLAERHDIQSILVPTPAVSVSEVRAIVSACADTGVRIQIVPEFDAILTGELTFKPRDVDIHDLLCREPVSLDGESVARFLHDRVVVVTGAAGSIGSEICRQVMAYQPRKLVLIDHSENGLFYIERELRALRTDVELAVVVASITDATRLRTNFELHRPAVLFHAAAHKHVPMMEANPGEAIKNNVNGTRMLVDEAVRSGVEAFVMISTDKAVNPTSVMGASKRLAEMYVQALSTQSRTRLVTVRFGNVLGSNGSVVPLFKEQIARGGPITVTHPEMTRYFMTIPEATQLVLQAGSLGQGGEIFVLDMGKPVRIVDLARDMIRLSGLKEGRDIEIRFSGLRPGEKLYEELYDPGEERLPTPHPKIFRAKHRPASLDNLTKAIERLLETAQKNPHEVVEGLKLLIPEYRPESLRTHAVRVHTGEECSDFVPVRELRALHSEVASPV
jgi:FlaA1/EpsC-like NDP-sugar epimerase